MVFFEICINTGYDPLERPLTEGTPLIIPGPSSGQLDSYLQPTNVIPGVLIYRNVIQSVESPGLSTVLSLRIMLLLCVIFGMMSTNDSKTGHVSAN